jgi:hypothetical protein
MQQQPSPLEILMSEYLPAAEAAAVETQVAKIQEPPAVKALGDLRTPVYGNDPNELLKHRFLYRGAMALLCGPTGIGKSSLLLQGAMHWAVGHDFFGILPGEIFQQQGMRILLVQAENDEGDLAEMRDGVLAGCDDLTQEEKTCAGQNIWIATVTDKSAESFAVLVESLLIERGPFDLVMVDPAFAYLGGDSNSQKDVSHFMRELLNPLAQKHGVGVILAHHTNKPLRGKEKDTWAAGDFAYLGAGSAEWINPVRAALALRSIGSDTVFEFRGAKRGKRLRWVDDDGNPTNAQYIAHHRETGVICWRKATVEEVTELTTKSKGGRRKQFDDFECVHAVMHRPGESQGFYVDLIAGALGCAKETVRKMLKSCGKSKWIVERGDQQFRRYEVTSSGREEAESRPSTRNWTAQ